MSGQSSETRGLNSRSRSGRWDDAELLAPPEVEPVQLYRSMFAKPIPRPAPAALTNLHLKKVARLDTPSGTGASADGDGVSGVGTGTGAPSSVAAASSRVRSARSVRSVRSVRSARSAAASSVRGGRAAFSIVSDEEVIDVDGEPTTLADDDMDIPASPASPFDADGPAAAVDTAGAAAGTAVRGQGADSNGNGTDTLAELEEDTPAKRLAEVNAELEAETQAGGDPRLRVQLAQLALGHARVVWRSMASAVAEEPLLLAKAHYALARAYQAWGCDRQASDHGKHSLAAIPADKADTEAARSLKTEVQVMRAEALLSSASVPGILPEASAIQARKALNQLIKAGGLQEPIAWTQEEVDENELEGHVRRATIDQIPDTGVVALMAECHGIIGACRLKAAEAEEIAKRSSLRSAAEADSRQDRRTERGDAFYSPEQLDKYREQAAAFRDEADSHAAEVLRLAAEAERAYDAALYCINHVHDTEGARLEAAVGREGKVAHPTFRAIWCRCVELMSGVATAFALQRKDSDRLRTINEILSAYAQYGDAGFLPAARHLQALKDKGALLMGQRDYEGATVCYEKLMEVISELYANDPVRKELHTAEALKLRGDVALGAGDFRAAQHMFNQALELYQRHLGVSAPVAQDLLHRIEEVRSYLADTRVMGRLAAFPGGAGPAGGGAGGAASGAASSGGRGATGAGGVGANGSASSASKASTGARSTPRPPPLPLASTSSHRSSASASIPLSPSLSSAPPAASPALPPSVPSPSTHRSLRPSLDGLGAASPPTPSTTIPESNAWPAPSPAAHSTASSSLRGTPTQAPTPPPIPQSLLPRSISGSSSRRLSAIGSPALRLSGTGGGAGAGGGGSARADSIDGEGMAGSVRGSGGLDGAGGEDMLGPLGSVSGSRRGSRGASARASQDNYGYNYNYYTNTNDDVNGGVQAAVGAGGVSVGGGRSVTEADAEPDWGASYVGRNVADEIGGMSGAWDGVVEGSGGMNWGGLQQRPASALSQRSDLGGRSGGAIGGGSDYPPAPSPGPSASHRSGGAGEYGSVKSASRAPSIAAQSAATSHRNGGGEYGASGSVRASSVAAHSHRGVEFGGVGELGAAAGGDEWPPVVTSRQSSSRRSGAFGAAATGGSKAASAAPSEPALSHRSGGYSGADWNATPESPAAAPYNWDEPNAAAMSTDFAAGGSRRSYGSASSSLASAARRLGNSAAWGAEEEAAATVTDGGDMLSPAAVPSPQPLTATSRSGDLAESGGGGVSRAWSESPTASVSSAVRRLASSGLGGDADGAASPSGHSNGPRRLPSVRSGNSFGQRRSDAAYDGY